MPHDMLPIAPESAMNSCRNVVVAMSRAIGRSLSQRVALRFRGEICDKNGKNHDAGLVDSR